MTRFNSLSEFYPYYLSEHSNITCRRLHFAGSSLVLGCIAALILTGQWFWLPAALFCGYGFAWVGHFFFEKNRPATFKYPFYSFVSDWIMYKDILAGKIPF
ncbi:MAG: DUF962 domain-containing protein [Arenimonas sp.]|nr:DUF962 domain-containing protein [Arenimonas sp.]